jgi:hypothetical protein
VDIASVPFDDSKPLVFGDAKTWQDLSTRRAKWAKDQGRKLSERELDIQQKLKTPVSVQFENQPLAKVIDQRGRLAGVNFYMDPQGLAEFGRGAGELAEDQHAILVGSAGAELLGHEVHAVAERCDHHHVGRLVHRDHLLRVEGAVHVVDGHGGGGSEAAVDVAEYFIHLLAEGVVAGG